MGPTLAIIGTSLALVGCSGEPTEELRPRSDARSRVEPDLRHVFPRVDIAPGQELNGLCQSWTVGNETPLYVNAVRAVNDGGWHHSNWVFVADTSYPGPDGTWNCSERNFSQLAGGVEGGVFFAQSTQALEDEQRFSRGLAIVLPVHARIIGDVHLLNTTQELVRSALTFEIDLLEHDEVKLVLNPLTATNQALAIPPRTRSLHEMICTFPQPAEFDVHYVLPHYHSLGSSFSLEVVGGSRDGAILHQSTPATGEAWGKLLDPPVPLGGATALRLTCGYDNPRDTEVRYGVGDQEMCVFLTFTSSSMKYGGFSLVNSAVGQPSPAGVPLNRADCTLFGAAGASL